MPLNHTGQIIFVAFLAVLFLLIIPVMQSRTGKSLTDLIFGPFRKKGKVKNGMLQADSTTNKPQREPRINNSTRGELTNFIAKLLRYANKHGMALVVPGTIKSGGQKANLMALLVTPDRIIGLQCLGYGGAITPLEDGSGKWNQHANYQDIPFDDPVACADTQRQLVRTAAERNGIHCPVDVYTVFTNNRITFPNGKPHTVFTRNGFFDFLDNTPALHTGKLDTRAVSLKLAEMAGIQPKNKKR